MCRMYSKACIHVVSLKHNKCTYQTYLLQQLSTGDSATVTVVIHLMQALRVKQLIAVRLISYSID